MSAAGSFRPDLPCKPAEYGVSRCIEPDASAASAANLFSDNANALSGQYLPGDVDIFQADVIVCAVCFDDLCTAENLWTIVTRLGIHFHKGIDYVFGRRAVVSAESTIVFGRGTVLKEMVHRSTAGLCIV